MKTPSWKVNLIMIAVAVAVAPFVFRIRSCKNLTDNSVLLKSQPDAYCSDVSHFEKENFHFLTLYQVRKSTVQRYEIFVDNATFNESINLFVKGCASKAGDYFSSAHFSDRLFGIDNVKIVERDEFGKVVSSTSYKVNVIYLEQGPKEIRN